MTYRIQLQAVFDSNIANEILNQVESQKSLVFEPNYYTEVPNIRESKKLEDNKNKKDIDLDQYVNINFDEIQKKHTHNISGVGFLVKLDISFSVEQDYFDFINFIETKKANADNSKIRNCRHFQCNHDSQIKPLPLDGAYIHVDFDGVELTYSL